MKSPSELAKTLELNKFVEIMKSANFQETRDEPYSIVAIQDEALEVFSFIFKHFFISIQYYFGVIQKIQ